MTKENNYKNINHIIHISTDVSMGCEHCHFSVGGDRFAESVNHYIEQHGYGLLHVGTETTLGLNDVPWHNTVAVVGK